MLSLFAAVGKVQRSSIFSVVSSIFVCELSLSAGVNRM